MVTLPLRNGLSIAMFAGTDRHEAVTPLTGVVLDGSGETLHVDRLINAHPGVARASYVP